MKITKDVMRAHLRLSQASVQLLEYADRNPEILKAENYKTLELTSTRTLQHWPTFVNSKFLKESVEAGQKTLNLIKSIPNKIFGGNIKEMSRFYNTPQNLLKFMLDGVKDETITSLLTRGDFILTTEGLKCIEFNINSNLGGLRMHMPEWTARYNNLPVINDFLKKHQIKIKDNNIYHTLFNHIISEAQNQFPGERESINLVVATPENFELNEASHSEQEKYFTTEYKKVLKNFDGITGEVFVCEYSRLSVSNGDLICKGQKIHAMCEWYQGFLPPEIRELYKKGNLMVYNGPVAWILSAKSNLALLSELQDSERLSDEDKEIIKKHIPWTRKVVDGPTTYQSERIDLKSFLLDNREKLVLKPVIGYGGIDVFIGREVSDAKWRSLVELAFDTIEWKDIQIGDTVSSQQWQAIIMKALSVKDWVVQEYLESVPFLYPWNNGDCVEHNMIWGFYHFGNQPGGCVVRTLPKALNKSVINITQGSRVNVLFEVAE